MSAVEVLRLSGQEARAYELDLAQLRIQVFKEFPYLYEGSLDYEKKYLETYFASPHSFICLLKDEGKVIGATTGILASEEEESFKSPFIAAGFDPRHVFYFGESVLLPEYRGKGLGKVFFQEREQFARRIGATVASFCAVVRENHPLEPKNYEPLDGFWRTQGFEKVPGLTTTYEWTDCGAAESTEKTMQYWIKKL